MREYSPNSITRHGEVPDCAVDPITRSPDDPMGWGFSSPLALLPPFAGNWRRQLPFMNVGVFGGTFDPVHRGHLAVARAARKAYRLGRIYFVPADVPPHKRLAPITPFPHRYAMLTLALRDEPEFVPSLIEWPSPADRPNYTFDTVRRFRTMLPKGDRLFFIIGIDAFLEIDTWHKPRELMQEVELIVVSRPGYRNSPPSPPNRRVHWLGEVAQDVSSTRLRAQLAKGKVGRGVLDKAVVEYIRKQHLYGAGEQGKGSRAKGQGPRNKS